MTFFFFFNDTATTEIYTLSLHDALPIFRQRRHADRRARRRPALAAIEEAAVGLVHSRPVAGQVGQVDRHPHRVVRSEEHTSELQSRQYLVCRLLLEKKKKQ